MNTTTTVNPTLHSEPPSPKSDLTGISIGRNQEKRILVISDDWLYGYDKDLTVQSNGLSIRIRAVSDANEALTVLKQWQDDQLSVDLITLDYNRVNDRENMWSISPVAPNYTEHIRDWWKENGQGAEPKIFWHSQGRVPRLQPDVGFHDATELSFLLDLATRASAPRDDSSGLLHYLNEHWGTDIPTNQEQLRAFRIKEGLLPPDGLPELVSRGDYTEAEALKGIDPSCLITMSRLDTSGFTGEPEVFTTATNLATSGSLAFNKSQVDQLHSEGKKVILVVDNILPEHTALLDKISGFVALDGNSDTGHRAVILDTHGIAALIGDSDRVFKIEASDGAHALKRSAREGDDTSSYTLKFGDDISIAGIHLYPAALPVRPSPVMEDERTIASWARNLCASKGLQVRANADTPKQIETALRNEVDGIGLVRTEHTFLSEQGLAVMRKLLLEPNNPGNIELFRKSQCDRFKALLLAAKQSHLPITIRLLDAQPVEFLSGDDLQIFHARTKKGYEHGARFGLLYPEVYGAQLQALAEAVRETRFLGQLEVMVPQVYSADDLKAIKDLFRLVAQEPGLEAKNFRFGAMIETSEAVDNSESIGALCDFVSFGTKDLTQSIIGCRRQDVMAIDCWMRDTKTSTSPFIRIAPQVHEAMRRSIKLLKAGNPSLSISVCGEHVSRDYHSVQLCVEAGVEAISVIPTDRSLTTAWIMAGKACAEAMTQEQLGEQAPGQPTHVEHPLFIKMKGLLKPEFTKLLTKKNTDLSTFIELASTLFIQSVAESVDEAQKKEIQRLIKDGVSIFVNEKDIAARYDASNEFSLSVNKLSSSGPSSKGIKDSIHYANNQASTLIFYLSKASDDKTNDHNGALKKARAVLDVLFGEFFLTAHLSDRKMRMERLKPIVAHGLLIDADLFSYNLDHVFSGNS